MKKLYCTKLDGPHEETEHCADGCVAVYLANEVDARIAELEKALRELAAKWRSIRREYDGSVVDALDNCADELESLLTAGGSDNDHQD